MPVTFQPSTVALSPVNYGFATQSLDFVPKPLSKNGIIGEIFQSNYGPWRSQLPSANGTVVDLSRVQISPDSSSFIKAAVDAYSYHHHLVMSPDNVWLAILAQFNLYVNGHAEQLRNVFVDFSGKRKLVVTASGTRYNVDFGRMAKQMTNLIQQNVRDPELRSWIIPDFSTTTNNDQIVASVTMMATLKSYFSYEFQLRCGLPTVTLLGEKSDWEKILARAEKLKTFGTDTQQWHRLLRPVLSRFVAAFDNPDAKENLEFWQQIAHHQGGGSGPRYLSGWITAFSFFDDKGESLYGRFVKNIAGSTPENFDADVGKGGDRASLKLDGVRYHAVETRSLPPSYAEVDVKLDDNGQIFPTYMVAGHLGIKVDRSPSPGLTVKRLEANVVQASAGWFLALKKEPKKGVVSRFLRSVDLSGLLGTSKYENSLAPDAQIGQMC